MSAPARATPRPQSISERGPVSVAFELVFGLLFMTIFSWGIGSAIELVGIYSLWPDKGEHHSRELVLEDLNYIAAAPRSLVVNDTAGLATKIVQWVEVPYRRLGLITWYERQRARATQAPQQPAGGAMGGLEGAARDLSWELSRWVLITMFVAQDTLLRLAIAALALPAFALACLLGSVDGLVRRDLRRWGGGRESSSVYHHSKKLAIWSLTGGFSLYLAWPFGGFNPAHMVLVFTVLVAFALSTALSAYKKYI